MNWWLFPLENIDFDISTIGAERTKHATAMFGSMNYFKNPDDPHRTAMDDLESLVYSMWFIAGVERDRYEGKSGQLDARTPEGLSLFASIKKEGPAAKFVVSNLIFFSFKIIFYFIEDDLLNFSPNVCN